MSGTLRSLEDRLEGALADLAAVAGEHNALRIENMQLRDAIARDRSAYHALSDKYDALRYQHDEALEGIRLRDIDLDLGLEDVSARVAVRERARAMLLRLHAEALSSGDAMHAEFCSVAREALAREIDQLRKRVGR